MNNEFIPQIKCTLCILYTNNENAQIVIGKLNSLGFKNLTIKKPKYVEEYSIDIVSNKQITAWDVDTALCETFSLVEEKLQELKQIVYLTHGKFLVDLVIKKYSTFPSIIFDGRNMELIRFLEADLSLDCYDFSF